MAWGSGTAFVKAATDDDTATALRTEAAVLESLGRRSWLPQLVEWHDGDTPVLVTEDLSRAHWPPPFPPTDQLFDVLAEVTAVRPPAVVTERIVGPPDWGEIEPYPFVDPEWWASHVGELVVAATGVDPTGDHFTHADLGQENLCLSSRGWVLVDWESASLMDGRFDIATISLDILGTDPTFSPPMDDAVGWMAFVTAKMAEGSSRPIGAWAADPDALLAARLAVVRRGLLWLAIQLGLPAPPLR